MRTQNYEMVKLQQDLLLKELECIVLSGYELVQGKALEDYSIYDIQEYLSENYSIGDIYSDEDIVSYIEDNMYIEDFLDKTAFDIEEYIKDNYYLDDLISIDWK